MSELKVSILLTSYNSPEFLPQAIESVLSQTYANYELIILDDNSQASVAEQLVKYWHHDKIKIYKSNIAASERMNTARYATLINEGFAMSSGDCITYLTDDDIYLPNRLADMVELLSEHSVVYGGQACTYDGENIAFIRPHTAILDSGYDVVDHCSVMHLRDIFTQCGGWDDSPEYWRGADGIFWKRIEKLGQKMYPVGCVTDIHRFHSGSVRHRLLELGQCDLN
jgi:spore maturation protein CgeD